jgi:hypothetical protein
MPVPDSGVDVPARAQHALTKKTLVKDWGLKPWELGKLTMGDLQDVALAERAESYIEHQQYKNQQGGGMRSTRNSDSYKDYEQRMKQQFGGIQ